MAARVTVLYMSTVGVFGQYNESFSIASQPVARSVVGGFELRPLFVGRWSQNMEHGPPHLDLWLDSFSLTLGLYNLWRQPRFCTPPRGCHDVGMELSLGMELPLLPQANTPFIALRGALRWSLEDLGGPHGAPDGAPDGAPHGGPHGAPPPMGLITLTLGYHHLFETHLVDAADSIPP